MSTYRRLRQICLVAEDLAYAEATLSDIFGLEVCYRDPKVELFGLENALFAINGSFLEIVSPTRDDTAASRFLSGRDPVGAYMAICDCEDLVAARQRVADADVRVIFEAQEERGGGIQLHPRDVGAAILELDHHAGEADLFGAYAWVGEDWQDYVKTDRIGDLLGIDLVSPDPQSLAKRWGRLLGVDPVDNGDGSGTEIPLNIGPMQFSTVADGELERIARIRYSAPRKDAILEAAREKGLSADHDEFHFLGVDFTFSDAA